MIDLVAESPPKDARELLSEFARTGDQNPFEEIVRRYGAMVYNVSYEVTSNRHDAEDATQAAFLSLAVQVRSGQQIVALGPWLQQVARRMALDINRSRRRRKAREEKHSTAWEGRMKDSADSGSGNGQAPDRAAGWEELRHIIQEEIDRMPAKYRAPLVLHYYGGMSRDEMARELGCRTNTLGVRLHRAREMLGKRLARRGVTLSGVLLGVLLAEVIRSSLSQRLIESTAQAAALMSAGHPYACGLVSEQVANLARSAGGALAAVRLKIGMTMALLAGGAFAAGAEVAAQLDLPKLGEWAPSKLIQKLFNGGGSLPEFRVDGSSGKTDKAHQFTAQAIPPTVAPLSEIATTPAPVKTSDWRTFDFHGHPARSTQADAQIPVMDPALGAAITIRPAWKDSIAAPTSGAVAKSSPQPLRPASGGGGGDSSVAGGDQGSGRAGGGAESAKTEANSGSPPPPGRGGLRPRQEWTADHFGPPNSGPKVAISDKKIGLIPTGVTGPTLSDLPPGPLMGSATGATAGIGPRISRTGIGSVTTSGTVAAGLPPTPPNEFQVDTAGAATGPTAIYLSGGGTVTPTPSDDMPFGGYRVGGTVQISSDYNPQGAETFDQIVAGGRGRALYQLAPGQVVINPQIILGYQGTGIVDQSGGRNTVDSLYMGVTGGARAMYRLTGGELDVTRTADDPQATPHSIDIGSSGEGVFLLGNAHSTGTITESGDGLGVHMNVGGTLYSHATLQGWGKVGLTGQLTNNGQVIADGYGQARTLDLTSFSEVRRDYRNLDNHGWYAINKGKLSLPAAPVSAGTGTYTWGDNANTPTITYVNSARATIADAAAVGKLAISLVSLDRPELPTLPAGHHFIGAWSWDLPGEDGTPLSVGGIDLTIRYDDAKAAELGLDENILKIWTYDGNWERWDFDATFMRDPAAHTLSVHLPANDFTYFAVSAPEPGTIGILVIGAGMMLGRRRRDRRA